MPEYCKKKKECPTFDAWDKGCTATRTCFETETESTESAAPSGQAELPCCKATDFNKGTWYQSAVSGMWYQDAGAAGDVAQIRLDGTYYIPFKSLKDKGL